MLVRPAIVLCIAAPVVWVCETGERSGRPITAGTAKT